MIPLSDTKVSPAQYHILNTSGCLEKSSSKANSAEHSTLGTADTKRLKANPCLVPLAVSIALYVQPDALFQF